MPTLKEIAQHVGVSISTVSRVMSNDSSRHISQETRSKIRKAAKELGYEDAKPEQPFVITPQAKSPASATRQIGCIVSVPQNKYNHPYFSPILEGIEKKLIELGCSLAYLQTMDEIKSELAIRKLVEEKNLEGNDLREGLMAVINIKMSEVEFVGQTKDQLGSASARSVVDAIVTDKMTVFLEENPHVGQLLIRKSVQASKAREAARKAREEIRSGKKRSESASLGGKLSPAQSKDSSRNELFIVEGDSAGGSAKQGRDSKYQAILPLKGKPMNPEKSKLVDILKNDEYKAIIAAIGAGIGSEFDVEECNYSKIIIMTDADTDGAHIQVLLLTFFYRYMKPLIDAGKVFIAQPPLYKLTRKSGKLETVRYAWTDDQLINYMKEIGKGAELQRYKGLGEMNPDQLWETTMNYETRTFLQVQIEDAAKAERRVSTLMGDKVDPRKRWIIENVDFTEYEE